MPAYIERESDNESADFLSLRPENPNQVTPYIEIINRRSVDGFAFRRNAKKAKEFRVIAARNFGNMNYARQAAVKARDAFVGELCTITTLEGAEYQRCMCLDVVERDVYQVASLVGGLATYTGPLFLDGTPSSNLQAIAILEFVFIHAGFEVV